MNRLLPPLIVIALALAVWLGAPVVGRRDPLALSLPFDSRAGAVQTATFRANYDAEYRIGLQLDRLVLESALPCLWSRLDSPLRPPPCQGADAAIAFDVAVSNDGHVFRRAAYPGRGHAMGGVGRETITLLVDSPSLRRGATYRVEVRNRVDAAALTPAHPRITVEAHPLDLKGQTLVRGLVQLAAIPLGLVGLIWLVVAALRNRRYLLSR